ncbi:hypothetical protein NDU88_000799, partial [Pleurodeles waltl]
GNEQIRSNIIRIPCGIPCMLATGACGSASVPDVAAEAVEGGGTNSSKDS